MYENKDYDVLTFVAYHQGCYASADAVKGLPLALWVRGQNRIDKGLFYQWVREIFGQLWDYHKCNGNPCYCYVNPWSFIVSEKEKIYLADIQSEESMDLMKMMKKRQVRESFLPEEEPYYQRRSISLDVYGLGKTIEFLMSSVVVTPSLQGSEEKELDRFVQKCLKQYERNPVESLGELEKYLPEMREPKRMERKWVIFGAFIILIVGMLAGNKVLSHSKANGSKGAEAASNEMLLESTLSEEESKSDINIEESINSDEASMGRMTEDVLLNLELGILYLMEVMDYEKSEMYFQAAGEQPVAQGFCKLAHCLQYEVIPDKSLKAALEEASECENLEEELEIRTSLLAGLIKGYSYLNMEESENSSEVIRLGGEYLKKDDTYKYEVLSAMASAYEGRKQPEQRIEIEKELLNCELSFEQKEEVYEILSELYLSINDLELATATMEEGVELFPDSENLRILWIKTIVKEKKKERKELISEIDGILETVPKLSDNKTFLKILKKQGLAIKNGKITEKTP